MKAVCGVIALGGVGTVLQGCGGGDAPVKVSCFHDQMNLVSQSIEATAVTNMVQNVYVNGTKGADLTVDITGTSTEKMNVKDFSFFFEVDGTTVTKLGDKKDDLTSWQRGIFSADKQVVVIWQKATLATMGVTINNCTIMPMPIPKEQLKVYYSQYLGMLQNNLTCVSNDGTFDTFHGDVDMGTGVKIATNIQMDKDYLMGGTSTISMDQDTPGGTSHADYTETTTKVVAGGPSADDLDWSKWGVECKKVPMPTPPPQVLSTPHGPGPSSMIKFASDAKKFNPSALHFFSQFMNIDTPVVAHEKNKMVVV